MGNIAFLWYGSLWLAVSSTTKQGFLISYFFFSAFVWFFSVLDTKTDQKILSCFVFSRQWTRAHPDVQRFAAITGGQNWIQELHHQMLRNTTDSSGWLDWSFLTDPFSQISNQWNSDLSWNQRKDNWNEFINVAVCVVFFVSGCWWEYNSLK